MKTFYERKPKNICDTCQLPLFFKRDWEKCSSCKVIFCTRHIYQYVDESNRAITKSSPLLCRECYRKVYNK